MTLDEIWAKARGMMGPNCRACPVCNGKACRGEVPLRELSPTHRAACRLAG